MFSEALITHLKFNEVILFILLVSFLNVFNLNFVYPTMRKILPNGK